MTWANIVAFVTGNWRGLLAGLVFAGLVTGGAALYGYVADLRVTAAEARASDAETKRAEAERLARDNAAAAIRMAERHQAELGAITSLAQRHEARAETLSAEVEALRRDPTHSAAAAPVLDRAYQRLRDARAARSGDPHRPGADTGGAAPLPAAPAAAVGGGTADARASGRGAPSSGGGAR